MAKKLLCLAAALVMITGAAAQTAEPAYIMTREDMLAIYQQSFDRMNTTMDMEIMTLDELPAWEKEYTKNTGRERKEDLIISSLPMEGDKTYEDALWLARNALMQRTGVSEAELDAMGVYPRLIDYVYMENESEWEFYFTPLRDADIMLDHDLPDGGEYRMVIGAQSGHTLDWHWISSENVPSGRLIQLAQEAALAHSGMDQEAFETRFADGTVHHYNRDTETCLVLIYTHTADQPGGDIHVYQVILNYRTGEIISLEYTEGVG